MPRIVNRIMGYEAKTYLCANDVNGQAVVAGFLPFGTKKIELNIEFDKHEVGDTRTGRYKAHRSGRGSMMGSFDVFADRNEWLENPATFGLGAAQIAGGQTVRIFVAMKGTNLLPSNVNFDDPTFAQLDNTVKNAGFGVFAANSFIITKKSPGTAVDEPVAFKIEGWANGYFSDPQG